MEREFIRKDCDGNDVYLKLTKGNYVENLLECYAYRKVEKKGFFRTKIVYEPIYKYQSELWDKRVNRCTTISSLNSDNKEKKLNKLLDDTMELVNESIIKHRQHKEAEDFLFNKL
jgi:hypothetical protein